MISRVEEGKWETFCSVRHSTLVSLQTFSMHMDLLDVEQCFAAVLQTHNQVKANKSFF